MSGSDPLSLKAPYSLAKAMDHEGVIRLFHLTTVKGLTAVAQVVARLIACLMIACSVPAFAEGAGSLPASQSTISPESWLTEEPQFLPVDEAFVLSATLQPNRVVVARWEMPDGYYLYRHQFGASLNALDSGAALGAMRIPEGKAKFDEFFGDVEVYYGSAAVQLPVIGSLPDGAELSISYQGCADAGLCYPPEVRKFVVSEGALLPAKALFTANSASTSPVAQKPANLAMSAQSISDDRAMANVLQGSSFLVALGLFFIAGIGLGIYTLRLSDGTYIVHHYCWRRVRA